MYFVILSSYIHSLIEPFLSFSQLITHYPTYEIIKRIVKRRQSFISMDYAYKYFIISPIILYPCHNSSFQCLAGMEYFFDTLSQPHITGCYTA